MSPLHQETPGCHRILVIEDNADGRASLQYLLKCWGYEVEVAADGLAGLAKALEWEPDAAVVDIGLPRLDGNEVARGIRAVLDAKIFLIALTAYCQPRDRAQALKAGFDAFLCKPADLDELARLLGTCA